MQLLADRIAASTDSACGNPHQIQFFNLVATNQVCAGNWALLDHTSPRSLCQCLDVCKRDEKCRAVVYHISEYYCLQYSQFCEKPEKKEWNVEVYVKK